MEYIGIDHWIGLECRQCGSDTAMRYSAFLASALNDSPIMCSACGRETDHGWRSIESAERMVADHMRKGSGPPIA